MQTIMDQEWSGLEQIIVLQCMEIAERIDLFMGYTEQDWNNNPIACSVLARMEE